MKVLVIEGSPDSESLNHAAAERYMAGAKAAGHDVKVIDLSKESFNPNLKYGYKKYEADEADFDKYKEAVKWADHIVFAFPIWWGAEPAILKGWFDRTFTPDLSRDESLQHKSASLIINCGGPAERLSDDDIIVRRWRDGMIEFCKIKYTGAVTMGGAGNSTDEARADYLNRAETAGKNL